MLVHNPGVLGPAGMPPEVVAAREKDMGNFVHGEIMKARADQGRQHHAQIKCPDLPKMNGGVMATIQS
jgi:hypothetical protein